MSATKEFGGSLTLSETTENYGGQNQGIQTVETWQGTREAVEAKRDEMRVQGIRYSWSDKTPGQLIVYRDDSVDGNNGQNSDAVISEIWNLDWETVDLLAQYAPVFTPGGVLDSGVLECSRDFDDPYLHQGRNITTHNYGTLGNKYRDKRMVGIDTYRTYRPILTQRILQATAGKVQASNVGVNKVWRINPKAALNKLGDLSAWSWLKLPARKDMVLGKIELSQQYSGAESWDSDFYPPYASS